MTVLIRQATVESTIDEASLRKDQLSRVASVSPEVLVSTSEAVTRTLRDAILQGKFGPGDRLHQGDLAAQLGVSRQPVREALRRLQSEGFVVQSRQRGMVVREFSESDIRENYRLRQLLEAEAAYLAAESIESSELRDLKDSNRAMAEALSTRDIDRFLDLNAQFHRIVRRASRMPTLVRLIDQLWVGRTVFTPLFVPGRASRSIEEHAALVAVLEERDPEQAASTMRNHIREAAAEYFDNRAEATGERTQGSSGIGVGRGFQS